MSNPPRAGHRTPADGMPDPRLCVAAVAENILRIRLTGGETATNSDSIVLTEFSAVPLHELTSTATAEMGAFHVHRGRGSHEALLEVTLGQDEPLFTATSASFTPTDLVRYDTGGTAPILETVKTVDGQRTFIKNLVPRRVGAAFTARLGFTPLPDEGLYGLGQDEDGGYQRLGSTVHLYHHNMRIPMPCLVSDHGYGILFDCGSLMSFDGTGHEVFMHLDAVQSIDFYLIVGTVDEVVTGFRRLTGSAPMLPKWAFGYIQSKERYETSNELIDVARRYRELDIPLDGIVQDWKTWVGDEWGQKTVDRDRFPDLEWLRSSLHALNVQSMVSVWPNMATGSPDHQEFAAAGLLLSDHSTYDAFDEHARTLYWTQLKNELVAGFDAWWCDSTEPFSAPDWKGSELLGEAERFELVGGEHSRNLGAERANLYALAHAQGIFEHELAEQDAGSIPTRRVLNLTRSGYPGSQRYGTVLWSGDVSATWSEFQAEIRKAITMGLCGVPWWTTDAGAFFTGGTACWRRWSGDPEADPVWFWRGDYDDGVANAGYRELYLRWLQFAAFLPMFRSHGTDTPREIWQFGAPGDEFYDAIAETIRLRYRLLPYVYTVAADAALRDTVMVRGLLFDFGDDPAARSVTDEFLLGGAILVCPVTESLHYGKDGVPLETGAAPTQQCYLPAGANWWDFWTGQHHTGGQTIEVAAPLAQSPLFVRAGSVIPMQGPVSHALENRDVFDVVVYPGANGGGRLYDDDGMSHRYQDGDSTTVEFSWDDDTQRLVVFASTWARERPMTLRVRLGGHSREITFDGTQRTVDFKE